VRGSSAASADAPWLLVEAVASLMLQPLDALCATADCALANHIRWTVKLQFARWRSASTHICDTFQLHSALSHM